MSLSTDPNEVDMKTRRREAEKHITAIAKERDGEFVVAMRNADGGMDGTVIYSTKKKNMDEVLDTALAYRKGSVNINVNPLPFGWSEKRESEWSTGKTDEFAETRAVTADIDFGTTKDEGNGTDVNGLRYPADEVEIHRFLEHTIAPEISSPNSIVLSGGGVLATFRFPETVTADQRKRLDKLFVKRFNDAGLAVDEGVLAKATGGPRLAGSIHRKRKDGELTRRKVVRLLYAKFPVAGVVTEGGNSKMLKAIDKEFPPPKKSKGANTMLAGNARDVDSATSRILNFDDFGFTGRNRALVSAVGLLATKIQPPTAFLAAGYAAEAVGLDKGEIKTTIIGALRRYYSETYDGMIDEISELLEMNIA